MLITIDPGSPLPMGEQVARQVRAAFGRGQLAPGERLPPARELAASLGINMHTVLRAYQDLRDDGLLELRQGRGAYVRQDADPGRQQIHQMLAEVRRLADRHGLTMQEVRTMLEDA